MTAVQSSLGFPGGRKPLGETPLALVLRAGAAAAAAIVALLAPPARAGPPFETDDPEPLPDHHGEVYLFASGGRDADGTMLDAAPGVELNYSFLPNTFAHIVLPLAYSDPENGGSAYGIGDIELGFKWRFLEQGSWWPDVAVFPFVEAPTGSRRRGLGEGEPQVYLPIWLQKDWGPWSVYGGGGYWIHPGDGNRNWWFTGLVLQRQLGERLLLGGEVFYETPDTVGGRDSVGFGLGGAYTIRGPYQLLFSAGHNLENARANELSFYLALYRAF